MFEEIYNETFSSIYNYVYARVLHRQNVEDIVSEVYLKAFANFSRFDPGRAKAKTWLITIARNVVNDYFRGRKEVVELDETLCSEDESVEDALLRHEDNKMLSKILAELTPEQRDLLAMRYYLDMKNKEIAVVLGLTEKAVSERFRRALEAGRKYAEKHSEFL